MLLGGGEKMPMYAMYCLKCMKMYEVMKKLADFDKETKCPHCSKPLQLEIKPVRFSFK
jgi:putative FmdB family regulatory protein